LTLDLVMKFVPPERPVIDKPRSTRFTLAEFTKLQLLGMTDDHPSSTFAPEPEKMSQRASLPQCGKRGLVDQTSQDRQRGLPVGFASSLEPSP
jgi:hypothetical protein